jgi:hypothetical protein
MFLHFMWRVSVYSYTYVTKGTNISIRRSLKFVYMFGSCLTEITALFPLQYNK